MNTYMTTWDTVQCLTCMSTWSCTPVTTPSCSKNEISRTGSIALPLASLDWIWDLKWQSLQATEFQIRHLVEHPCPEKQHVICVLRHQETTNFRQLNKAKRLWQDRLIAESHSTDDWLVNCTHSKFNPAWVEVQIRTCDSRLDSKRDGARL